MGKLRSGILGHMSGKVAGVVGSQWKDISTLREYRIPANPDTVPQQTQRNLFAGAVAFGKLLVGQVFNVFVDKFQRSMSGFNFFISQNITFFPAVPVWASLKIVWGKLFGITPTSATYSAPDVTFSWVTNLLGNNGSLTDKISACVYDTASGVMFFSAAPVARSVGTIDIPCWNGLNVDNLKGYIWSAKYSATSPTLLEMVSDSTFIQVLD